VVIAIADRSIASTADDFFVCKLFASGKGAKEHIQTPWNHASTYHPTLEVHKLKELCHLSPSNSDAKV
jgi:hypothetical protein